MVATICVAVGVPTTTAAVGPNRTMTGGKLKFCPRRVTFAPGKPCTGVNWEPEGSNVGADARTLKVVLLVTVPPDVSTEMGATPGATAGVATRS